MSGGDEATAEWQVWSTTAAVTVTDPRLLQAARRVVEEVIADVDAACSRFRPDSELMRIAGHTSQGAGISTTLAALLRAALDAAAETEGDVDPTVGGQLVALGYDRDIGELRELGAVPLEVRRLPPPRFSWHDVRLESLTVTAPDEIVLDLGATGKASAADRSAARIAAELGCGVLVSLGGDIATAGPRDEGPWQVLVQDTLADPAQQVSLSPGWAMATSSTQKRRWRAGGRGIHHILDPRSGLPAPETWRTVTVVAPSCAQANALSTAAIIRGAAARGWLGEQNAAARLVDSARRVHVVGGWPEEPAAHEDGVPADVR